MKKFLVEDMSVGASKGGIACGPVSGLVIAEIRLKDTENGTVSYHALTEVGGTLNFSSGNKSTFDIQVKEDYEDEASWATVEASYAGGYSDYNEFYKDLGTCDEEHRLIWKLLAYLVRAEWDETAEMKANNTGKYLDDIEIPICDAEQEYLDEHSSSAAASNEKDSMEAIRSEYEDLTADTSGFNFEGDETAEGYYTFEESFQSKDGSEYKGVFGYDLDEDGVIIHIPHIRCKRLVNKDTNTYEDVEAIPDEAYEILRRSLDELL